MAGKLDKVFYEITAAEAPHLHKALEELCAKAKMAKPQLCQPSFAALFHPLGVMLDHLAGAFHADHPRIVLGDSARKIFGHAEMGAEVSEQLKAVLAHELGHLKKGDCRLYKVIPMRLSPFIGLAAAMGGLALYDHLTAKPPLAHSEEEQKKQMSATLDSEIAKARADAPWFGGGWNVAKYVAAGALGLIGGTVALKLLQNHIEFRADKFSAELMGSGKPLAEALQSFKTYADNITGNGAKTSMIGKFIEWIIHPDITERISRLNSM